ncbi:MAG: chemotaxis protein MotB [Planctomycetota bacterium]|jgi:chemotaxis protein MotB
MDDDPPKEGAPAWMVSFGDMMTLILTFFILLVSLAEEQQSGLLAKGVGSFVVAIRSFGLDGVLDGDEEAKIFSEIRTRFNLPPEEDVDRRAEHADASDKELIRATLSEALTPHDELNQPTIATFELDSSTLSSATETYLEIVSDTLNPAPGQVLILEGHAFDAGEAHQSNNQWLAFARARAVRNYLVNELGLPDNRIEARAWIAEIDKPGVGTRSVDARLITPEK